MMTFFKSFDSASPPSSPPPPSSSSPQPPNAGLRHKRSILRGLFSSSSTATAHADPSAASLGRREPVRISEPTDVVIQKCTTEAAARRFLSSGPGAPTPPSKPARGLRRALSLRSPSAPSPSSLHSPAATHSHPKPPSPRQLKWRPVQQPDFLTREEADMLHEIGVAVERPHRKTQHDPLTIDPFSFTLTKAPSPASPLYVAESKKLAKAKSCALLTASRSSKAASLTSGTSDASSLKRATSVVGLCNTSPRPAMPAVREKETRATPIATVPAAPAAQPAPGPAPKVWSSSFFDDTDSESDYASDDATSLFSLGEICVARQAVRCKPTVV